MDYIRMKNISHPDWNFFWEVYENSFPIYERRTKADQLSALLQEDYYCEVFIDNGHCIGILGYWYNGTICYVEHFAIAKTVRGMGYGTVILNDFAKRYSSIILEIDPLTSEIAQKRKQFYEHIGFHANPYAHFHPPYRKGYLAHELIVLSFSKPLPQYGYLQFFKYLQDRVMQFSECAS